MKVEDLIFQYPEELIATEPRQDHRTLWKKPGEPPQEISKSQIAELFGPGDVLIINDTRVDKRRVFSEDGLEVLFVNHLGGPRWEVLFPARKTKVGGQVNLPGGISFELIKKGIPQEVLLNQEIDTQYFNKHGELALPPYIQKARGERHNVKTDESWYQTAWAEKHGSSAAPTASLHFSQSDLDAFRQKGVRIHPLTLHVGLGTFLPVRADNLEEHEMHTEPVWIPKETINAIGQAKANGGRVWALGTTVTRSLEAWAQGHLHKNETGDWQGETDIFIRPGFEFQVVDVLMTNFHQPGSTLLALVAAFADLEPVLETYQWAVQRGFRLFSYGDLSIWSKT